MAVIFSWFDRYQGWNWYFLCFYWVFHFSSSSLWSSTDTPWLKQPHLRHKNSDPLISSYSLSHIFLDRTWFHLRLLYFRVGCSPSPVQCHSTLQTHVLFFLVLLWPARHKGIWFIGGIAPDNYNVIIRGGNALWIPPCDWELLVGLAPACFSITPAVRWPRALRRRRSPHQACPRMLASIWRPNERTEAASYTAPRRLGISYMVTVSAKPTSCITHIASRRREECTARPRGWYGSCHQYAQLMMLQHGIGAWSSVEMYLAPPAQYQGTSSEKQAKEPKEMSHLQA